MKHYLYKVAEEGKKDNKELTGAAIGAATGGLLSALVKKWIDGDKETAWTDYLPWVGLGTAAGGGLGYGIASSDLEGYSKAEIEKVKAAIDKLKKENEAIAEDVAKSDLLSFVKPTIKVVGGVGAGLGSRWAIRKTFSDLYNDAKIYADDIKKAKIEFRKLYDYKQKLHEAQKAGKQGKVWRTDKKGNPIHYRQAFREARDNLKTVMRLKNGKWYWKKLARGGLNLIPWTIGGLTTLSGIGDGINAYSKWQEDGSMPFNISRHFIKPYNDIQQKNLEQNLELMEKNFNPNR